MRLNFIDNLPSLRAANVVASALSPVVTPDRLSRPFLLTVVVTRRCNSRCQMCNIWQEKSPPELTLNDYRRIFREPWPFVRALTITGGEPTLRSDLPDVFDVVLAGCPNVEHLELATSGLNVKRTLRFVEQIAQSIQDRPGRIAKFNIQISLDGLDEMHDTIRGIDGFFEKVTATLDGLTELGQRFPFVQRKISSVVMPQNLPQAQRLREYAAAQNIPIHFSPIVVSGQYYANTNDGNDLIFISGAENSRAAIGFFDQLSQSDASALKFYYADMAQMLGGAQRGRRCMMGFYGFILEHDANIYACVNCEQYSFGSVLTHSFDEVWFSPQAEEARRNVRSTCCPNCVSMCYTLPAGPGELSHVIANRLLHKNGSTPSR